MYEYYKQYVYIYIHVYIYFVYELPGQDGQVHCGSYNINTSS